MLQVLGNPLLNTFQGSAEILHRVSDAKTQVSLAELSERRTGEAGDASLFQESVSDSLGFPSSFRDIRENIESSFWHAAGEARNLVQAGDEHIAATLKL